MPLINYDNQNKQNNSQDNGGGSGAGAIIGGIALIALGLLISVGTYMAASNSPGGGRYFITIGFFIGGIRLIAKGLSS